MKISVRVHTRSSKQRVVKGIEGDLEVYLAQAPVDGKANKALIESLAGYYKVRKSAIHIAAGSRSRNKIIEIDNYKG